MKHTGLILSVILSIWCLSSVSAGCSRCGNSYDDDLDYVVPEARVEVLSPRGLKISIPATADGIELVAFHININEEFMGVEHGRWAQDIRKTRGGRYTIHIPEYRAKQGDTIYYWIHVVKDNKPYQGHDRSYRV